MHLLELRERRIEFLHGHTGKLRDWEQAAQRVQAWQNGRQKVVFTNGCFDLCTPGIRLLESARRQVIGGRWLKRDEQWVA